MEIVFNVTQEGDGGFAAECLSHDIFTEGDTWEQLRANVREAVSAYFFDGPKPSGIRLHESHRVANAPEAGRRRPGGGSGLARHR